MLGLVFSTQPLFANNHVVLVLVGGWAAGTNFHMQISEPMEVDRSSSV